LPRSRHPVQPLAVAHVGEICVDGVDPCSGGRASAAGLSRIARRARCSCSHMASRVSASTSTASLRRRCWSSRRSSTSGFGCSSMAHTLLDFSGQSRRSDSTFAVESVQHLRGATRAWEPHRETDERMNASRSATELCPAGIAVEAGSFAERESMRSGHRHRGRPAQGSQRATSGPLRMRSHFSLVTNLTPKGGSRVGGTKRSRESARQPDHALKPVRALA
jgi:hypothetical protein